MSSPSVSAKKQASLERIVVITGARCTTNSTAKHGKVSMQRLVLRLAFREHADAEIEAVRIEPVENSEPVDRAHLQPNSRRALAEMLEQRRDVGDLLASERPILKTRSAVAGRMPPPGASRTGSCGRPSAPGSGHRTGSRVGLPSAAPGTCRCPASVGPADHWRSSTLRNACNALKTHEHTRLSQVMEITSNRESACA
jgi:hypothetical protein